MAQLSVLDKEDIRYVVQKAGNGRSMLLNLSDERQERFLHKQLELAGIHPKRRPQLFKTITDSKVRHAKYGAPLNEYVRADGESLLTAVDVITQLDTTDGQNYVAGAISSIPGNSYNVTLTLGIFDGEDNPLGEVIKAEKHNNDTTFFLQASGSFSSPMPPEGRSVKSVLTYQYTNDQGTTFGTMPVETFHFPKTITNISPSDINKDGAIVVCLNRQEGNCDYWHGWDTGHKIQVPIKGNIEYFSNIDPIQFASDGTPTNASCTIQIAKQTQPGNPIKPLDFNFFKAPNTTINGPVLSWDLDWLYFDPPNFNSGELVYYIFNVIIQIGRENVVAFITNAPPSVTPGQNFLNTLKIPSMEIVYGCMAEGTLVRMADNSLKTIETIVVGEEIVSDAKGSCLTVENTVIGVEDKPMFHIEDNKGNSLFLTEGHPVITGKGVRLARELIKGDKLLTESGASEIISIQEEMYAGKVWNLHLIAEDKSIILTDDNRTHFANGIMVGDGRMQRIYGDKAHKNRNKDDVLAKLPKQWHQDYLNWLEDQQCQAQ
ncbi:Hint domain-containing protein [Methanosarcina sp. Z-7115]|uniref:Hint domain-containing protein n=1 Tax=Methanosarcina baikalica TaxID=3073890 RepID=A0ABU2D286_9EURY|nr:Hint domain-containing protein [Methanosarcina sp. Z-7115]MDR7666094.1 Hint domain-containing protein [Methanosarcina sp. Z-7115]